MAEYDPFDWETAHNPYPVYRWLRDEAPVYYNERLGFWALSRYDDVVAAHLNTDDFSSAPNPSGRMHGRTRTRRS